MTTPIIFLAETSDPAATVHGAPDLNGSETYTLCGLPIDCTLSLRVPAERVAVMCLDCTEATDYGPSYVYRALSDGTRVSIHLWGNPDHDGRNVYRWAVENAQRDEMWVGTDIRSGVGAAVDAEQAFASFASFVGAFAETDEDSDNADLFPAAMRAWAQANADELFMISHPA